MRSLWRRLALQWLGGDGSGALSQDTTALEMLLSDEKPPQVFDVRRVPGVSYDAMMSSGIESRADPQIASEEALRSGPSDNDLC
jgi:hypothetical protein